MMSKSDKNIAYKHNTCADVAKQIRKKLERTCEYEVGEKIICRKWFKINKDRFNVNFEYEIVKVINDSITILDSSTMNEYTMNIKMIRSNFIFSYCGTCHSYQGSSIDESMTIHDYKYHFVNRRWLWTAITRATDLNNVWFIKYNEKPFDDKPIRSYLHKKIEGYKLQDKKAQRIISNNYVTVDWLMKSVNKSCCECGCNLELNLNSSFPTSNITAQRLDNSIDHNIDNIIPMCDICNCSLSNKF